MTDYGTLTDYATGVAIRPATREEHARSLGAGPTGAYRDEDGRVVYVAGGPETTDYEVYDIQDPEDAASLGYDEGYRGAPLGGGGVTDLGDLGARLTAAGHLPDPVLRARELIQLQAVAAATIAAATDAAAAEACEQMPTAEVAARLGVSEHQIRRRLTAHRARIGRPGRPGRRPAA